MYWKRLTLSLGTTGLDLHSLVVLRDGLHHTGPALLSSTAPLLALSLPWRPAFLLPPCLDPIQGLQAPHSLLLGNTIFLEVSMHISMTNSIHSWHVAEADDLVQRSPVTRKFAKL